MSRHRVPKNKANTNPAHMNEGTNGGKRSGQKNGREMVDEAENEQNQPITEDFLMKYRTLRVEDLAFDSNEKPVYYIAFTDYNDENKKVVKCNGQDCELIEAHSEGRYSENIFLSDCMVEIFDTGYKWVQEMEEEEEPIAEEIKQDKMQESEAENEEMSGHYVEELIDSEDEE